MVETSAINQNAEDRFLMGGDGDGISPFRPPNDEEVFVTRETEK